MPLFITELYQVTSRFFFRLYHYILLPLRYRIEVKGINSLDKNKTDPTGGLLILSNHPTHLDASLLGTALMRGGKQVTIWTVDYVFKNPYTKFVSRNFDTTKLLKVPNVTESRSPKNRAKIRKLIQRTISGLHKGENILFFPGGAQKYQALEEINGKSAVERILRLYPNVNIILVRMIGLWGSRFSKAAHKSERSILKGGKWFTFVWNIVKMFVLNLIFFIPKRNVLIEFTPAPSDFPRNGSRKEINLYLENYFNRGFGPAGEPLQSVPTYFWKAKYIPHEYHLKDYRFDLSKIPEEIKTEVCQAIANKTSLPTSEIQMNMLLDRDLSLDSLEIADLLSELEQRHQMPKYLPKNVSTVGHLAALVAHVPVESVPILGQFPVIHKEPPFALKTYQACAGLIAAFLSFLHLNK